MNRQLTKPLAIEEYEICNKLKSMRFSGMAAELERVFADPNADLAPFRDKIQRIGKPSITRTLYYTVFHEIIHSILRASARHFTIGGLSYEYQSKNS